MFPNPASEFVYTRTYSRWLEEKGRREKWDETVDRFIQFISDERKGLIPTKVLKKVREKILNLEVMPSMRALWSAGPAAKQSNVCMYNCSAVAVDSIEAFAETLYILCCGAGLGFSVQNKYIEKLPIVSKSKFQCGGRFVVEDSKEGWADSVKILMNSLYSGQDIEFDYSEIRPAGSRLKTMGGRSSGPEPLMMLHRFIREIFNNAQGRKLNSLEAHDIMNKIGEIVVVGGVRRSSEISLSDLNDELMKNAKNWPFPLHRSMANNSAVYLEKPSAIDFMREWTTLAASGTGERGIFNLYSVQANAPERRDRDKILLTNPCGEVALRNMEFCNLSEVVVRSDDDLDSLLEKVETATWIGVIQSTFTDFPYLRKEWKKNCEEERLLGVSLTGQMDNKELLSPVALRALKQKAIKIARHAAQKMGVNMSSAITLVKPSGTVSQVVDSASGLHARYSKYYIRRYRISSHDPLCKMLKSQNVELIPEVGQENLPNDKVTTWVIEFPIKSPEDSITRNDLTAIDQLEWYKTIQINWCEHNPSTTIYVKDSEWLEVGNWVYKNWDIVNGISFLPYDGGKYKLAPYEEITKEKYKKLVEKFKKIDYSKLSDFEKEDNTEGAKILACQGGVCEL